MDSSLTRSQTDICITCTHMTVTFSNVTDAAIFRHWLVEAKIPFVWQTKTVFSIEHKKYYDVLLGIADTLGEN